MRGSWRGNINRAEPQPELGAPPCPRLPAKAKKIWQSICGILSEMGVLTVADGAQLERYARYVVRWRELESRLAGKLKDDVYALFAGESHRLDRALKQIEANFGLTPSARSRLTAPEKPDEGSLAFARKRV